MMRNLFLPRHLSRNTADKSACVSILRNLTPKRRLCNTSAGGESSSCFDNENLDDRNNDMKDESYVYDVAVIGGGMVGMALACSLSSMPLTRHLKVAIVDSNPTLSMSNSFKKSETPDSRVSAITPATISFFKEMGAWEYVMQQRHAFFDKMQVWDYTGLGYTRYNATDVGKEHLGCVVENKVLQNSLLSCFQSNANVQSTIFTARLDALSFPSQIPQTTVKSENAAFGNVPRGMEDRNSQQHSINGNLAKLELSNDDSIYAKLVVGADGGKSRVRDIMGVKTTGWDYSQNAIICTVEHDVENHCAWQRFLPSGPIALLPMSGQFSNIVWTMNPVESLERKSMSPEDFVNAVNHALDYGYGPYPRSTVFDKFMRETTWFSRQGASSVKEEFQVPPKVTRVVSERLAFPLSLKHAHAYALKRVVLVGDAAHIVHPLAGQGVNLGFGDVFALSKMISEGISVGKDFGELSVLKKYEKERKAANITMMAILDGFQKAYSVDLGPLNILRAAAFHGAHHITPLKRNIISYATGDQRWPLFT